MAQQKKALGNGRGRVHRRVRGSVSPLASWSPIAARVVRRRRPVQSTHTEEHTPVNPGSTAANTHPGDAVPAIPRARGHRAGPPLVVDAKLVVLLHETPRKTKTPIKDKTKTIDSTTAPNLQDAAAQGTDGSSAPRVASSRSRTSDEPHIGKYKLLKTIGKGNFAKVKLAKHVPTGKEVKNLSEVPRELVEEKLRAKYLQ